MANWGQNHATRTERSNPVATAFDDASNYGRAQHSSLDSDRFLPAFPTLLLSPDQVVVRYSAHCTRRERVRRFDEARIPVSMAVNR